MRPVFKRRARGGAALAVAAVLALGASACSSAKGSNSGSGSDAASATGTSAADLAAAQKIVSAAEQTPTNIPQTLPLPSKPPSGKSIVFVSSGLAGIVQAAAAVHEAASAVGWSFSEVTFTQGAPASLQAALLTALAKKPTVVAEIGSPQSLFGVSTIKAYAAAKVPIILGSAYPITYSNVILGDPAGEKSEENNGKILGAWFVAASKGNGNALFESYTSAPVLGVFSDAFQSTVKSLCQKCKVKVVGITEAEVASNTAVPLMVSTARANPSYKYMFFDNGQFGDGIVPALASASITGITIGGRSIDDVAASAIRAGTEQAWTGQSYYLEGYALMDIALRYVLGAPGAANNEVMPLQLFTSSNIALYPKSGIFASPADALAQYEKLWHVPVTACKFTCP
jgi:ABC-type sugar transport system substrate-binding protein